MRRFQNNRIVQNFFLKRCHIPLCNKFGKKTHFSSLQSAVLFVFSQVFSKQSAVAQGTAAAPYLAWQNRIWCATIQQDCFHRLQQWFELALAFSPGLFPFSSPGTFGLLQSRDNRTTGPSRSRSCPVQSRDQGPLVLGLPGTSRDQFGRLFEQKISSKIYVFLFL